MNVVKITEILSENSELVRNILDDIGFTNIT